MQECGIDTCWRQAAMVLKYDFIVWPTCRASLWSISSKLFSSRWSRRRGSRRRRRASRIIKKRGGVRLMPPWKSDGRPGKVMTDGLEERQMVWNSDGRPGLYVLLDAKYQSVCILRT